MVLVIVVFVRWVGVVIDFREVVVIGIGLLFYLVEVGKEGGRVCMIDW